MGKHIIESPRKRIIHLPLHALLALFICTYVFALAPGALSLASEPESKQANWQSIIDTAEPIYQAGNYKDALPFYKRALEAVTAGNGSPQDVIHCLRILADCYCRLNQPDEAHAQYERISALIPADNIDERITILNDKALTFELKGDWAKSESLSLEALKLCSDKTPDHFWQLARTLAHLGYINYMVAKYAAAIPFFQKAERAISESGRTDVKAEVLRQKMAFAQAGSQYHLHNYEAAYQQFKQMYDCDVRLFGKTDLQTGWAMLALSDVLRKTDHHDQAQDWYRKAIYVFRKYNRDRLIQQFSQQPLRLSDLSERIDGYIFGKSSEPSDVKDETAPMCKDSAATVNTHDPRTLYARPFVDAPGRVWLNPTVPQKGIIIAIHGLSLEHSSYDAFATKIADAGYTTVAFDVRGFGSYRQALGAEQIDIDECIGDLKNVVSAIRADNPNKPLFLLGESMGGAIALQLAAKHPELMEGLIASVPAGKRFAQKRTTVKVALHYLEHKNKTFDIGSDVINRATKDPKLKEMWSDDPKTRSMLTPRELIAFQEMMNRNIDSAKKIHSTPVIIFQGVSDGLVKPEATYDLFRAIACKDKDLVMIGNAEHLIFEEGRFTPAVIRSLVAWMESHGRAETAERSN
jgi:lysophospholipase